MADIYKTNNNELLPIVVFDSISVDNDIKDDPSIDDQYLINTKIKITPRQTSLDDKIKDKDYLKYLSFTFVVTTSDEEQTELLEDPRYSTFRQYPFLIQKLSNVENIDSNFTLFLDAKLKGLTSDISILNLIVGFDIDQYLADNNLNFLDNSLFETIFGTPEIYTYPIMESYTVFTTLTTDYDLNTLEELNEEQTVDSIVSDVREFDFLANKTIIAPSIKNIKRNYIIDIYSSTDYSKLIKNFFVFDYNQFLIDKSYINKNIDKYKILLNIYRISKNLIEQETVDKIRINKEVEQELEVISSNNISKLIKEENGKYLFYFEDNLPERSNNIKIKYIVEVLYTDQTFFKIYEPNNKKGEYYKILNQYTKIKNLIFLAYKNAYSLIELKNKELSYQPLIYLNTDTSRFTQDFINFYNKQIVIDTSEEQETRISVSINDFINNLALFLNKFLSVNELISSVEVQRMTKVLDLKFATITNYLRFFKEVDAIMKKMESIFSNVKQNVARYSKNSLNEFNYQAENSYFSISEYENNLTPTIQKFQIQQLLNNSKNGLSISPRYLIKNKQKIQVLDIEAGPVEGEVDTGGVLFNSAMAKASSKIRNSRDDDFNIDSMLLEYGCSFTEYREQTIKSKKLRKFIKLSPNKETISVFLNNQNETELNETTEFINNEIKKKLIPIINQKDNLTLKKEINKLTIDILFKTKINDLKINENFVAPTYILDYYNFNTSIWEKVSKAKLQTLTDQNLFFRVRLINTVANVFETLNIDVDTENTYFMVVNR